MKTLFSHFLSIITLSFLIGCGGGSNSVGDKDNQAPTATAQSVSLVKNTDKEIVLLGTDPEESTLSYSVVTSPSHGTYVGTTYTPNTDYTGSDSFTFKANDGDLDSIPATVSIVVTANNQAPTATAQSVSLVKNTSKEIILSGTDPEESMLSYSVVTPPSHGTYVGTTYTPNTDYTGSDSFTFKANDGDLDSPPATISIQVVTVTQPTNQAPTADSQTIYLVQSTSKKIILTGTDPEMSNLTFSVIDEPQYGTVFAGLTDELGGDSRTYKPNLGYLGPDSFTFKVNDGELDSPVVTVFLNVLSNKPLTQKKDQEADGVFDKFYTYTYDESGNNQLTRVYQTTSGIHQITTSTYDDQDRLSSRAQDNDGDGQAEYIHTYIFDINHGKLLTVSKDVDADGVPDFVQQTITYDANDYPQKEELDFDGDGVINQTYRYTHSSSGLRLTEEHESLASPENSFKITYSYNLSGYRIKREKDNAYDENNPSIDTVTTYSNFHVTGKPKTEETDNDNDGNIDSTIEWTYNDAGKKLSDRRDMDNDGDIDSVTTWTYNPTNQVLTRNVDNENDGTFERVETSIYNEIARISRKTVVIDGAEDSVVVYTY